MKKSLCFTVYVLFFVFGGIVGMHSNSTMVISDRGIGQPLGAQAIINQFYPSEFTFQDSRSTVLNRKQRRAQKGFKQHVTDDQKIVAMNRKINKNILNVNNESCFCDRWLKYWSAPWVNNFDDALKQAEIIESYVGTFENEQLVMDLVKTNSWFTYVLSSLIDYTEKEAFEGSFITGKNIDSLMESKGHLFPTLSKTLSKLIASHAKERYVIRMKKLVSYSEDCRWVQPLKIKYNHLPMLRKEMVLDYKLASNDVYISEDGCYIKATDQKGYDFIWDLCVDRDYIWYLSTTAHIQHLGSGARWIKMSPYSETRWEKRPYPQYGEKFALYKGSRALNEEQWDSEDKKVHLSMFLLDIDEDKEKYERRLIVEFIPSVESRTCDLAFFNSKSEADFAAVLNSDTFKKLPLVQQRLLKSRVCSHLVFGVKAASNHNCK